MQDPSISGDKQRAINEAVIVIAFTASGMRGAMLMQMTQALPVLAIDHARAPGGMAACDRKGQRVSITKRGPQFGLSVPERTKLTPGEAVE